MPQVKARHTARGVVIHDGAVVLIERWRQDPASGKTLHYFSVPGGKIEAGETAEKAAVRELYEETSLLVRPMRLIATQYFEDGSQNNYFLCAYLSGGIGLRASSPEPQLPTNRSQPRWVTEQELKHLTLNEVYEPVRELILHAFGGRLGQAPRVIK